ncbi:MAG: ribokinase [Deltaproteobacteria bacterium]|nr:ribokinase [Deltaproteobacteria bacterium]
MRMYDVCVIGHVTKDRICIPGREDHELPGGTAYYVSRAWAALGRSACVVTKVAPEDDEALLGDLRARGIHVFNRGSRHTTVFENRYSGEHLSERHQRVLSLADPFEVEDLAGIAARAVHVGPLTRAEVPLSMYRLLPGVAPLVGLDGQGLLRVLGGSEVRLAPADDLQAVLPYVHVLKVDDTEAEIMVGEADPMAASAALAARGVREVLMTFADQGSAVRADGRVARIPAVPPARGGRRHRVRRHLRGRVPARAAGRARAGGRGALRGRRGQPQAVTLRALRGHRGRGRRPRR